MGRFFWFSLGYLFADSSSSIKPLVYKEKVYTIEEEKTKIRKEILVTFLLGLGLSLLSIYILSLTDIFKEIIEKNGELGLRASYLINVYMFCAMVSGWYFLGDIKIHRGLSGLKFIPFFGVLIWGLFFVIRLNLGMYIGPIVLPFRTFLNIKKLKRLQNS